MSSKDKETSVKSRRPGQRLGKRLIWRQTGWHSALHAREVVGSQWLWQCDQQRSSSGKAAAEHRAFKTNVSNYGYRFKGQNGMPLGPHQSSGKRKKRATWKVKSEEDSEEQTKEPEQFWDKIWTGKRGLRWDKPPSPPFLTCPETAVVLSRP